MWHHIFSNHLENQVQVIILFQMEGFKYYVDTFQTQVHSDLEVLDLAALVIGQPQTCENTTHLFLNKSATPGNVGIAISIHFSYADESVQVAVLQPGWCNN